MTDYAPPTEGVTTPPTCDICGGVAKVNDGIVGANLCYKQACLDDAWNRAFGRGA